MKYNLFYPYQHFLLVYIFMYMVSLFTQHLFKLPHCVRIFTVTHSLLNCEESNRQVNIAHFQNTSLFTLLHYYTSSSIRLNIRHSFSILQPGPALPILHMPYSGHGTILLVPLSIYTGGAPFVYSSSGVIRMLKSSSL